MLEQYLQEIGLPEKEVKVYLHLLSVDQSTVLDLAKQTKIKRPTVYTVLKSLAQKGLISETTNGKKTHYQAEPPERLKSFVERQKLELDERSHVLSKEIIPQLKSLQRGEGERPVVKYYEGKEGAISALEELVAGEEFAGGVNYVIYPEDLLAGLFSEAERKKYRNVRISRGIKSKVLYTSTKGDKPFDSTGDRIRIDGGKYPITCDISIYKDRVRIATLGQKLSSIFIKSQELADTLKSLIDLVHDNIKRTQ